MQPMLVPIHEQKQHHGIQDCPPTLPPAQVPPTCEHQGCQVVHPYLQVLLQVHQPACEGAAAQRSFQSSEELVHAVAPACHPVQPLAAPADPRTHAPTWREHHQVLEVVVVLPDLVLTRLKHEAALDQRLREQSPGGA